MKYWCGYVRVLFAVVAVVLNAFAPCAIAQRIEDFKIIASDGAVKDLFGRRLSISGGVVIVGANEDDDNGSRSGSAYIYRFNGLVWLEESKLLASDGQAFDNFGSSVSINSTPGNEVAIVGAVAHDFNISNTGAAYIYRFNGVNWVEEQILLASDGRYGDRFGQSVSITGPPGNEVAIVGAPTDDDDGLNSGSVYVFRCTSSAWVLETKLLASDGAGGDVYGASVSISGSPENEVVIIGATGNDDNGTRSGSAYIYRKSGANWVEVAKLLASDGTADDLFGQSLSISAPPGNEVAIVGVSHDDDNGSDSGSAYIYRFDGSVWVETKLLASDGAAEDRFGGSVSISSTPGNVVAIVGASFDDDNGLNSGSAYVYRFNGVNWVEEQQLLASDGAAVDVFGLGVSISCTPENEVAIVGAQGDDDNGENSGSVYLFYIASAPCPGDFDDSGAVNVSDLLTLLSDWGPSPGSPADTNNDDMVNVTDLLVLLASWGDC